jgi:hypothetical protein
VIGKTNSTRWVCASKQDIENQRQPTRSVNWKRVNDLGEKIEEDVREADSVYKPPHAAVWKSSICRIQLVSGFHLGKIWSTISKALILKG